jgi:cytochrome c-type biogenesis protein
MEGAFSGMIWAAWLGILTSISPCPLATNIAAVSFIGNDGTPRRIASCGLAYAAGRMAAYLALAVVLVAGILSSSWLSNFLQHYMNRILGPILILTGMVLLELLSWSPTGSGVGERIRRRAEKGGVTGALILGTAFALSCCPGSCSAGCSHSGRSPSTGSTTACDGPNGGDAWRPGRSSCSSGSITRCAIFSRWSEWRRNRSTSSNGT